jgi:hypothetical protein
MLVTKLASPSPTVSQLRHSCCPLHSRPGKIHKLDANGTHGYTRIVSGCPYKVDEDVNNFINFHSRIDNQSLSGHYKINHLL